MSKNFFKRKEKKYLLSREQFEKVRAKIEEEMAHDGFFESEIYNVYFDNAQNELISQAIQSEDYKCKVRARNYGKNYAEEAFLEIKSKIDGTVFKRRIKLKMCDFEEFLRTGELEKSQVGREILHIFEEKNLKPKVFIAYNRLSYKSKTANELRITFDTNLRFRHKDFHLKTDENCERYFKNPTFIMETKTVEGFPSWLVDFLSKNKIYPSSFSKYGKIYQQNMYNLRSKNV